MADILFTNNASALLAVTITAGATSIQVAAGFGALFPSPSTPQYALITLEDDSGNIEIVKCTSRATDILTVVRAQEGTTAKAFTLTVTRVELRLTAAIVGAMVQVNGDTMTGDLTMATNQILNAYIAGSSTRITAGQIVGVPLRGTVDDASNEIDVPSGGGRATAGAVPLVVNTDDIVALLDTAGVITFDSASVGVVIPAGAYLRIQGTTASERMNASHDDTDFLFVFLGTTLVKFDTRLSLAGGAELAGTLAMADNQILRPRFLDFAVDEQTVSGTATTDIDYEAGSYVNLNLAADITTFTLSNPPATGVGSLRIKITQDASPRTITWPASVKWPGGTAPVLSTGASAIDFADLWTDDAGTTWYGAHDQGWA